MRLLRAAALLGAILAVASSASTNGDRDLSREVKALQNMNARAVDAQFRKTHGVSREVEALRRKNAPCAIRGVEPSTAFVVFTRQRAGSRWFVNTLDARSGGRFNSRTREISLKGSKSFDELKAVKGHAACLKKNPSKPCSCVLRQVYANANTKPPLAPGFKFMIGNDFFRGSRVPRMNAFAASICDLKIPFVFLLRKNILRRIISLRALEMNKALHVAHPDTEIVAEEVRHYKPRIQINGFMGLAPWIARETKDQSKLLQLFKYHCGGEWHVGNRLHWYEDLVDGSPTSADEWGNVLFQLGAWNTSNATRIQQLLGPRGWRGPSATTVVHGSRPVADLVANFGAVNRTLRGTRYAWMLD